MIFETLLTVVVLVNAIATVTLWQEAVRRPEKVRKKFLKSLLDDGPITPKHQPPPPLEKISTSGWGIYGHEETLPQFFDDYKDFAATVNRNLGSEYPPATSSTPPGACRNCRTPCSSSIMGLIGPATAGATRSFTTRCALASLRSPATCTRT
jgi:hypothetical protein